MRITGTVRPARRSASRNLHSREPGHLHVEENDVRAEGGHGIESLDARRHRQHLVALLSQRVSQELEDFRHVIGDQNTGLWPMSDRRRIVAAGLDHAVGDGRLYWQASRRVNTQKLLGAATGAHHRRARCIQLPRMDPADVREQSADARARQQSAGTPATASSPSASRGSTPRRSAPSSSASSPPGACHGYEAATPSGR
jgi:hypothetical protein